MTVQAPDQSAQKNFTQGGSTQNPVSLAFSKTQLERSRLLGRVSAFIFLLAALAVLDSLQTLVRHEFNSVDLVPGETIMLAAMLPEKAKSHTDLEITVEGDVPVRFEPIETYKGFWMGGQMWRAAVDVAPDIPASSLPDKVRLTVVDIVPHPGGAGGTKDERDRSILYGGKQNPALVFTLTIWPSEADRQAADSSLFRRYTGFPAFGVAAMAVLLALAVGIANWLVFSKAEAGLAGQGVFFIHGVKDIQASDLSNNVKGAARRSGYKAAFARAGRPLTVGVFVVLLDREWQERSKGIIVEADKIKGHALFPHDGVRPQYGWLVAEEGAPWQKRKQV